MREFRALTIKGKLLAMTLGVSVFVLLLSALVLFGFEYRALRNEKRLNTQTLTRAIAANSAAALVFDDAKAAREVLAALASDLHITEALLQKESGEVFATYPADLPVGALLAKQRLEQSASDGRDLEISERVLLDHEPLGWLRVRRSLADVRERLEQFALMLIAILACGSVLAYLLSHRLQWLISRPITHLAEVMQQITSNKDYSMRVRQSRQDEIGNLIQGFNSMLAEVEKRDQGLQRARDELELRVLERTSALTDEIAERERIEQALRREKEQLRIVLKDCPVAVAMTDMEMRYLVVSDQWLKDYGLVGRDIIGKSHYEIFPQIPERWKEIHRRVLNGATESCAEDPFEITDDYTMYLRWKMLPWYRPDGTQGGTLMATIIIDELVNAREAALHTAKLRSQFIANTSHELRTPLNGILGFAELLLDYSGYDEAQREYLETIKSSGRLLLNLINEILDFSKIESGRLEIERVKFSPAELVQGAIKTVRAEAARKGLKLDWQVSSSIPQAVYGDPTKIQQILFNLLGNSLKFTSTGGVWVRVDWDERGALEGKLRISIRDTGIGIPEDKQELIFTPFAQADGSTTRKYGGTGLGLTICAKLAAAMGGRVWVESAVGEGSTFYFTVAVERCEKRPAVERGSAAAKFEVRPQSAAPESPMRILVVEDNLVNQKLMNKMLTKCGYDVVLAGDGAEAVKLVQDSSFDIVLMDLQMPIMGGVEATAHIRKLENSKRSIPIIALTAHALPDDRDRCIAAGMDGFLTKPIDRGDLLKALSSFCARQQGESTHTGS